MIYDIFNTEGDRLIIVEKLQKSNNFKSEFHVIVQFINFYVPPNMIAQIPSDIIIQHMLMFSEQLNQ